MTAATATHPTTQAPTRRYTATAMILHWLVALLFIAAAITAWVMKALPRDALDREDYYTLHKSLGLTILALVAVRLAWRATHHAPPLPATQPGWERRAAFASHWLLYLVMLGMPVSGYLVSAAGGNPVTYFGLVTLPGLPKSAALRTAADWVHVGIGQWAVYALVTLHILATIWHVAIRRDGTLDRMLPAQER